MSRQRDITFFILRLEIREVTLVEQVSVFLIQPIISHLIEDIDKICVILTIDMIQFHADVWIVSQHQTIEEIDRLIIRLQQFPFVRSCHRSQLLYVANHKQLHSAESSTTTTYFT